MSGGWMKEQDFESAIISEMECRGVDQKDGGVSAGIPITRKEAIERAQMIMEDAEKEIAKDRKREAWIANADIREARLEGARIVRDALLEAEKVHQVMPTLWCLKDNAQLRS